MCDIRVEKLKLNKIYMDVAAQLAASPDLPFDAVVARFAGLLQSHYQEFCNEACIEAKAREFAKLYYARISDGAATPANRAA